MSSEKVISAAAARRAILKAAPHLAYIIDELPQVDAAEVAHGKWIAEKDEYEICATDFTCSNCKETFCSSEIADEDFLSLMQYCPNYGAKMDGGNDK